jgi:diaminopimelate epimerase
VAEIRIFNPDGSQAELSGNGVRQAVMYLRRSGWVEEDSFTVLTGAGEVRPRIHGELCTMDIGRARLRSSRDFPSGDDGGRSTLRSAGREFAFQFVQVGNPQCAIELSDDLDGLDLNRYGPEIEGHELFPRRTNVSFWRRTGEHAVRARIFERGVGETMSSGTGASGAAVAAVLRGVQSPVTVTLDGGELEVDVQEDLTLSLTGWARPVYAGTLADEFLEELREAQ